MRLVVSLLLLVVFSGCLQIGGSVTEPGTSSVTTTETETTITPRPYPEQPKSLDGNSAAEFAQACERTHFWNQHLTGVTNISIQTSDAKLLNETEHGFVVHLEMHAVIYYEDGHGDEAYAVNYFVNETVTKRVRISKTTEPGPGPRNGTSVQCSATQAAKEDE